MSTFAIDHSEWFLKWRNYFHVYFHCIKGIVTDAGFLVACVCVGGGGRAKEVLTLNLVTFWKKFISK